MRKTLLTATALAALLVAPALAYDVTAPAPAAPAATDTTLAPVIDQAAAPDVTAPGAADTQIAAAPAVNAGEKFIAQQQDGELLASNLIGSTVYSAANDNLGDINDIVFTKDGKIGAIVIGVGGFLGMGEKNVAVSFAALQESTDENGGVKLVLDATADELSQAPAYETVAMLKQKTLDLQNQPTELSPTPPVEAPAPAPVQ
jgi:PRC-barrel domain